MKDISFDYYRDRLLAGFDGKMCKVIPHIMCDGGDNAYMFYTMLNLSGSDVFHDTCVCASHDGGRTFGEPRVVPTVEYTENGIRTIWCYSALHYHRKTGKWLCFGQTQHYKDDKHPIVTNGISHNEPYLVMFDPDSMSFGELIPIPFPVRTLGIVPHGQIIEYENGELLVSFYYTTLECTRAIARTVRYAFDGQSLTMVKAGEPLVADESHVRGYCEPSVAAFDGKYYMTIRTDEQGLLAVSEDGYTFSAPQPWRYDDGSILPNYNTQHRWVRFADGLFLVYTRRGAHNDHVFRHRAPLFMARFDEDRQCLIRKSEIIAVPEMGARLGNFGVVDVNGREAWISVAEWMQSNASGPDQWKMCAQYGSDNAIWRTRIVQK